MLILIRDETVMSRSKRAAIPLQIIEYTTSYSIAKILPNEFPDKI